MEEELRKLKAENVELKEQLENYIPRRRVRRVYKQLKTILEADIIDENKQYIDILINFIQKIEKEGPQEAGQDIKTAIEHVLGLVDLNDVDDSVVETTYIDNEIVDKVISNIEGSIKVHRVFLTDYEGTLELHRKE